MIFNRNAPVRRYKIDRKSIRALAVQGGYSLTSTDSGSQRFGRWLWRCEYSHSGFDLQCTPCTTLGEVVYTGVEVTRRA